MRFSARLINDYTSYWQDPTNLQQVGRQHSQYDLRVSRIAVSGNISPAVTYFVSANYNALDWTPDLPLLGFYDVYVSFPLKSIGKITIGKQKETFGYEMVGNSVNLSALERVLTPFFQSRSWGVKVSNTAWSKRMTWSAGLYELNAGANQATARITALPLLSADGDTYLHAGLDYRYRGPSHGTLRFEGRPQSDPADYFVDTGDFNAKYANQSDYELLLNTGPFALLSEYAQAWVNAPQVGNPKFFGYYVTASWVITGENRPYDTTTGYARRVIPRKPSGAYELTAEFSRVNLANGGVAGGAMGLGWVGFTWWQSPYWRYSIGYGTVGLDRFDSFGQMHRMQMRVQWVR